MKKLMMILFLGFVSLGLFHLMSADATPVPPLPVFTAPADGGCPSAAFYTQLNSVMTLLKAGTANITQAQAPNHLPIAGGTMSGHEKLNNAGVVMGTNVAGITGQSNKVIHQTADAGLIVVGATGNSYHIDHTLPGAQLFEVTNQAGSLDAGNSLSMKVQGAVVEGLSSHGVYASAGYPGLDGGYGDAMVFSKEDPHVSFEPIGILYGWSGSFTGAEVLTIKITAYDTDDVGFTASQTSYTASQTAYGDGGGSSSQTEVTPGVLWRNMLVEHSGALDAGFVYANTFQRLPIDRLEIKAMSTIGASALTFYAVVFAAQN